MNSKLNDFLNNGGVLIVIVVTVAVYKYKMARLKNSV